MRTEFTSEFNCPPERLWEFLDEPEKQKLWMKGLKEMRVEKEVPGVVGSTFVMKIMEGKKVAEYDGEVTAHDRPKHLAVRFWGGAFPKGMVMNVDYRLTDLGGRTRLDYVAHCDAQTMPYWMSLLMPLFKLFGRWQLRSYMRKLKELAEQPA